MYFSDYLLLFTLKKYVIHNIRKTSLQMQRKQKL